MSLENTYNQNRITHRPELPQLTLVRLDQLSWSCFSLFRSTFQPGNTVTNSLQAGLLSIQKQCDRNFPKQKYRDINFPNWKYRDTKFLAAVNKFMRPAQQYLQGRLDEIVGVLAGLVKLAGIYYNKFLCFCFLHYFRWTILLPNCWKNFSKYSCVQCKYCKRL